MLAIRLTRGQLRGPALRHFSTPSPSNGTKQAASPPAHSQSSSQKLSLKGQPAPLKSGSSSSRSNSTQAKSAAEKPPSAGTKYVAPAATTKSAEDQDSEPTPTLWNQWNSPWSPVYHFQALKNQTLRDISAATLDGTFLPKPDNMGSMKTLFYNTWELGKFYGRGVRTIWRRTPLIWRIPRRIQNGGDPLTRAEYVVLTNQKKDMIKVIPYVFVAIILEEAIPFLAIIAPTSLPSPWLLPEQRRRLNAKRDQRAATSVSNNVDMLRTLVRESKGISWQQIKAVPGGLETFCGLFSQPTFGPTLLRGRRLAKHLAFIGKDDQLLRQEDNGAQLTPSEVDQALRERGILLNNVPAHQRLQRLQTWLKVVDESPERPVERRIALAAEGSV